MCAIKTITIIKKQWVSLTTYFTYMSYLVFQTLLNGKGSHVRIFVKIEYDKIICKVIGIRKKMNCMFVCFLIM